MPTATYRANQLGLFLQDKFQIKPNLTLTAGMRYDWDGGLTEKYGNIFNFDPSLYSYISTTGPLPAGETAGNPGAEPERLHHRRQQQEWNRRRQQNHAHWPPVGLCSAYRRGMGANQVQQQGRRPHRHGHVLRPRRALQLLLAWLCHRRWSQEDRSASISRFPSSPPRPARSQATTRATSPPAPVALQARWNFLTPMCRVPRRPTPRRRISRAYLPNATAITNGAQPVSLGVYDRQNKLPYSINYTLDIQWQPRNDLAFDFGYVGNLGRHQVIPVPFNQPNIASPSAAVHSQNYSYGYTPTNPDGSFLHPGRRHDGAAQL